MVLGVAASQLVGFGWIFHYVFNSVTSSLFDLKASNLGRWPISTLSFMRWCQFIDWFKFETHPSSLHNSGMANRCTCGCLNPSDLDAGSWWSSYPQSLPSALLKTIAVGNVLF